MEKEPIDLYCGRCMRKVGTYRRGKQCVDTNHRCVVQSVFSIVINLLVSLIVIYILIWLWL